MANEIKGVRGIRTLARLVDSRRARTPAGALLELSSLANEKHLLERELQRWSRRHAEIELRMNEIAEKERRLMALVVDPNSGAALPLTTAAVGRSPAPAPAPALDRRFKVQELTY